MKTGGKLIAGLLIIAVLAGVGYGLYEVISNSLPQNNASQLEEEVKDKPQYPTGTTKEEIEKSDKLMEEINNWVPDKNPDDIVIPSDATEEEIVEIEKEKLYWSIVAQIKKNYNVIFKYQTIRDVLDIRLTNYSIVIEADIIVHEKDLYRESTIVFACQTPFGSKDVDLNTLYEYFRDNQIRFGSSFTIDKRDDALAEMIFENYIMAELDIGTNYRILDSGFELYTNYADGSKFVSGVCYKIELDNGDVRYYRYNIGDIKPNFEAFKIMVNAGEICFSKGQCFKAKTFDFDWRQSFEKYDVSYKNQLANEQDPELAH